MAGLSTTGIISFGWAFVYGRNRVPSPAAGMTAFIRPRRTVGLEINPSSRNRKSGNDRRIGSAAEDDEPNSVQGLPIQGAASVDDDLSAHSLEVRAHEFAPLGPVVVDDAHVRPFQSAREVVRELNARHGLAESLANHRVGYRFEWAAATRAWTSFGKQDPPKPNPAFMNFGLTRGSRPTPSTTSSTLMPPNASQMFASSFAKETFVARNAFVAYLTISAVRRFVAIVGACTEE